MRVFGFGLAFLAFCVVEAADVVPLDVKPGLWEITSVSNTSGAPPIPQDALDKMPPDMRAKMEASIKARQGPRTSVRQQCVKKEDLAKALDLGTDQQTCTRTIVSSSRGKQEMKVECTTPNGKSAGTFKIEALNPESIKGAFDMAVTSGGRTMTVNSTMTGKYLSAGCPAKP
jgi:Protein of unknown function (DUF3617)